MARQKINGAQIEPSAFQIIENSGGGDYTQTRSGDWSPTTNRINNTDITFTPTINMKAFLNLEYSAAHGASAVEFDPAIVYKAGAAAWATLSTGVGDINTGWTNHHRIATMDLTAGTTYIFQGGVSTNANLTVRDRRLVMIVVPR